MEELVTLKKDDLDFLKEGIEYLMNENAELKKQLEPVALDRDAFIGLHEMLTKKVVSEEYELEGQEDGIIEDNESEDDADTSDFID